MDNKQVVKVPNKSGAKITGSIEKDSTSPTVRKGGDLRSGNSNK